MPEIDIFTEMHTDLKYIRNNLETHIKECKGIRQKYIGPLWEKHQQEIGASKTRRWGGSLLGYAINAGIAVTAAWAAVRSIKP